MGLIYINGVQISFAGSWELIVWQSWVDIESNEDGRGREERSWGKGGWLTPELEDYSVVPLSSVLERIFPIRIL